MKIGLLGMSAKPYHAGHDKLVRIASKENDSVMLFVSTTDRARPGELQVSGDTMQLIWWDYIEPTLPSNVVPDYGGVPVSKVYTALEKAEVEDSQDTFVIYSDDEDIVKYTDQNLINSAPTLFANGQIERRGISRSETAQVSGTEMREFIENADEASFIALLPPAIQKNGKAIFELLQDEIVGESLVRRYIKTLLEFKT